MDNMNKQNMEQNTQNPAQSGQNEQDAQVVEFSPAAQKPASKKPQSMNYTHTFTEPVEILGKKYTSLTFYFENLTGDDVELVEQELQQRNIVVLSAEVCSPFQIGIAARAAGMPSDELSRLPLREYMKIKNAARNFLVAVGY